MQFNALMDSVFKHRTRERINTICDMSQASNGTAKTLNKYLKELRRQADIMSEGAGTAEDFLRDFGGGL